MAQTRYYKDPVVLRLYHKINKKYIGSYSIRVGKKLREKLENPLVELHAFALVRVIDTDKFLTGINQEYFNNYD